MGGVNSGWRSPAGRKQKRAVSVSGSGKPTKPADMPEAVAEHWDRLAVMVAEVAKSEDSIALAEAAWLSWRSAEFAKALAVTPLDESLNRTSLAVGRALSALLTQFALTPRSRQTILVAVDESEEQDPLEKLMNKRKFFNSGVPNRVRDLGNGKESDQ